MSASRERLQTLADKIKHIITNHRKQNYFGVDAEIIPLDIWTQVPGIEILKGTERYMVYTVKLVDYNELASFYSKLKMILLEIDTKLGMRG